MGDATRDAPAILAEVLEIVGFVLDGSCSAGDDFFEIGGGSLTAMRVVALVEDRLGVPVSLEAFLDAPTLGAFAEAVAAEVDAGRDPSAAATG